jgi:hypothetical protein
MKKYHTRIPTSKHYKRPFGFHVYHIEAFHTINIVAMKYNHNEFDSGEQNMTKEGVALNLI